MLFKKDYIRVVISLIVAIALSTLLHKFIKMSHLMGKFIVPVSIFTILLYLLREYWPDPTPQVEEGLSPQFLNYGHTEFDNSVEKDDSDAVQSDLPQDHPQYNELLIPRQNETNPEAFNASNMNVSYAYVKGSTSNTQPPEEIPSVPSQDLPCAVGSPCSGGLCSQPNVYNPMNLVAPTPGPQWQPQRASVVQERLIKGEFVPTTAML